MFKSSVFLFVSTLMYQVNGRGIKLAVGNWYKVVLKLLVFSIILAQSRNTSISCRRAFSKGFPRDRGRVKLPCSATSCEPGQPLDCHLDNPNNGKFKLKVRTYIAL